MIAPEQDAKLACRRHVSRSHHLQSAYIIKNENVFLEMNIYNMCMYTYINMH